MLNPTLHYTTLFHPGFNKDTVLVNQIKSGNMQVGDWISFKKYIKASMKEICNKGEADLLIPVSWKTEDFEPVLNSEKKALLDSDGSKIIRRCSSNVADWYLLPLDVDDYLTIDKAKELFSDYEYIAYTTFSHSTKKHKFRMQTLQKRRRRK